MHLFNDLLCVILPAGQVKSLRFLQYYLLYKKIYIFDK